MKNWYGVRLYRRKKTHGNATSYVFICPQFLFLSFFIFHFSPYSRFILYICKYDEHIFAYVSTYVLLHLIIVIFMHSSMYTQCIENIFQIYVLGVFLLFTCIFHELNWTRWKCASVLTQWKTQTHTSEAELNTTKRKFKMDIRCVRINILGTDTLEPRCNRVFYSFLCRHSCVEFSYYIHHERASDKKIFSFGSVWR